MRSRLLIALALVGLCSCGRPLSGELFLASPRNSYDFPLTVVDSLALYDFAFYTRVDGDGSVWQPVRLDISWVAPSETVYRETVYMLTGAEHGTLQRYRSYVRFPAAGQWTLKVAVSPEVEGFRGLGLTWKEKRWDTTN
ncbi:MAG: hypothetical protein J6X77_04640 [Bacteroidales bacterium]|nr:hypothetical protein [Bacteroidales bacterium]